MKSSTSRCDPRCCREMLNILVAARLRSLEPYVAARPLALSPPAPPPPFPPAACGPHLPAGSQPAGRAAIDLGEAAACLLSVGRSARWREARRFDRTPESLILLSGFSADRRSAAEILRLGSFFLHSGVRLSSERFGGFWGHSVLSWSACVCVCESLEKPQASPTPRAAELR